MRISPYFNPLHYKQSEARSNFKDLNSSHKILTVTATIFASLAGLPLFVVGAPMFGAATFRKLVESFSKTELHDDIADDMDNDLDAAKKAILQGRKSDAIDALNECNKAVIRMQDADGHFGKPSLLLCDVLMQYPRTFNAKLNPRLDERAIKKYESRVEQDLKCLKIYADQFENKDPSDYLEIYTRLCSYYIEVNDVAAALNIVSKIILPCVKKKDVEIAPSVNSCLKIVSNWIRHGHVGEPVPTLIEAAEEKLSSLKKEDENKNPMEFLKLYSTLGVCKLGLNQIEDSVKLTVDVILPLIEKKVTPEMKDSYAFIEGCCLDLVESFMNQEHSREPVPSLIKEAKVGLSLIRKNPLADLEGIRETQERIAGLEIRIPN